MCLCVFQGGCGASSPARAQDPAELRVTRHGSRSSDPTVGGQAQGEIDTPNVRRLFALSVMPTTVGDCPGASTGVSIFVTYCFSFVFLNLVLLLFLQAALAYFALWLRFRLLYVGLTRGGAHCH